MYVKSLMSRIKGAPAKAWNDWKIFRNYPGMEYRDIHGIIPKSHMWKFPSQGSIKYENRNFNADYFKWDYKLAYRMSPYFIRRIFPEVPQKNTYRHAFPITPEDMAAFEKRHMNWKDATEMTKFISVDNSAQTLEDKHEEYAGLVSGMFENRDIRLELIEMKVEQRSIYDAYFPVYDNYGSDKQVDPSDMDSKWLYIYFDNMQILHDYDKDLKENHNYQRDVYVGRTKAWQVVPDFYGKNQVDKVQAAIGAPLQDQLDEWEVENLNKKIQCPISNENMHKFRDEPDHFEVLDHDYERIVYERQKKQKYEQLRNTRYDELLQIYYKNNIVNQ